MQKDVGILELHKHLLGVGDEVRRNVAAIELHAFDDFKFRREGLRLLDRNDAFLADFLHCLGYHRADFQISIGGDRSDLADFLARLDFFGTYNEIGDHGFNRHIDTPLEIHRVHAGSNRLAAFTHDGLRQNSCCGRAVTSLIVGLRRNRAHHLGAHIFEPVLKLDFPGDRHTILGDAG